MHITVSIRREGHPAVRVQPEQQHNLGLSKVTSCSTLTGKQTRQAKKFSHTSSVELGCGSIVGFSGAKRYLELLYFEAHRPL